MRRGTAARGFRRLAGLIAWTAAGALLAACGGGAAPPTTSAAATPAAVDTLVAKAKGEKGLVLYGNPPADFFKPVLDGFKAAYPGISVEYTDLTDNEVFSKYQSEHAQGARTADVILASAPALWIQAEANGLVANVTPQGLSRFPAYTRQGPGLYVMSPEPIISTYNTKLLTAASAPNTYTGLAAAVKAEPSRYPLVSYPIDNQLGYAAIYGLIKILGWDRFWSIQDQLAPSTKTYSEGLTGLTQIATGAASYGYVGSGLGQATVPLASRGLAAYLYMQDATPLVPRGIAVTAGATSPASAQLFLDYVFSDAGQQTLCRAGFEASQNGFAPADSCPANLTALEKQVPSKNVALVPIAKDVLDQQSRIVQRWNQAYHR
ncbi:MAG TPA: extracellular solute-binding protein [Candidatus Dormibacteraeota bacterium]|jgi:iron(III) transport system substrate-binding protein